MILVEIRHIRYFLAVSEELNFTRAAEKLCIAQPPLSRQIQDLEAELGAKLFIRKPHALQLTEEGILFKQYASQILNLVTQSTEDIREIKKGLRGTLYLASVEGHGPRLFSEWIAGFNRLYPHVQYNLWNGNSDDVVNRVMKGLCELAIIMEPYNAEGVESLLVYEEPWIAMISHSHPLAQKESKALDIDELIPYDLIIPSRASRLEEISGWFSDTKKTPVIRCRMAHMLNAYELVRQNVGIAIYPASAADIAREDVCIKTITRPSVTASYVLIWNKTHHLSHVAQEFIAFVKSTMK